MIAICDQRGAVDLAADPDAKDRDRLVAEEAYDRGGDHCPQIPNILRVHQSLDAFITRDERTCQDHKNDRYAGYILDPTEAEGEPRSWPLAAEPERDCKRNCSRGVGEIVDGIRQQRHASRDQDDDELQCSGYSQTGERPFDRPHSAIVRRDGWINDAVRGPLTIFVGTAVPVAVWIIAQIRTSACLFDTAPMSTNRHPPYAHRRYGNFVLNPASLRHIARRERVGMRLLKKG